MIFDMFRSKLANEWLLEIHLLYFISRSFDNFCNTSEFIEKLEEGAICIGFELIKFEITIKIIKIFSHL